MKKRFVLLMVSVFVLVMLAACNKADEATTEIYTKKAEEVVALLNDKKYDDIVAQFDKKMAENLTAAQLTELEPVIEKSGKFENYDKKSVEEKDGYKIVVLVAKHSEDKRIYTVTYDSEDKIAGLHIQ